MLDFGHLEFATADLCRVVTNTAEIKLRLTIIGNRNKCALQKGESSFFTPQNANVYYYQSSRRETPEWERGQKVNYIKPLIATQKTEFLY